MAKIFTALPTNAANGPGTAVDFSGQGAAKTIVVEGNGSELYEPYVLIEVALDAAGVNWSPLAQFLRPGSKDVTVAAYFMRANVKNYKQGGAPTVSVGAEDLASSFATLVAPAGNGNGAGVDVTALPTFKTIQVTGTYKGSCNIEISTDGGTTYSQLTSFRSKTGSGIQSAVIFAEFMRVTRSGIQAREPNPGLPVIRVGASAASGGGGGGSVVTDQITVFGDGTAGTPITLAPMFEELSPEASPAAISTTLPASVVTWTPGDVAALELTLGDGPIDGYRHHVVVFNEDENDITLTATGLDMTLDAAYGSVELIWDDAGGRYLVSGAPVNFKTATYGPGTQVAVDGATVTGDGTANSPLIVDFGSAVVAAPVIGDAEARIVAHVLPANTLVAGATFRVRAYGTQTGAVAAGDPSWRLRVGPVTLTGNIAVQNLGYRPGDGQTLSLDILVTFRTVGAAGTVIGCMEQQTPASAPLIASTAVAVAVDTTVENLLELTGDSNEVGNTFTFRTASITRVA